MNLPWALLRIYSRTTLPLSILILNVLLFQISVPTVYGQFDEWQNIFPPPNETITTPPFVEKQTLESLEPFPSSTESSPQYSESDDCQCLKFWQCANNTIITDGTGLLDIRGNFGSQCPRYEEKCCYLPDTPIQVTNLPIFNQDVRQKCGIWNKQGIGYKITGNNDNEAEFSEFPWMVVIFKIDPQEEKKYLCSGSLIHPKVVLTVAHHLSKRSQISEENLIVRAGEWDLKTEPELLPHQDRSVSKILIHENFVDLAVHNDIALIFLTEPFIQRKNVGTICLPPQGFKFDYQRCQVSGWGGTSVLDTPDLYQAILKKIDVPIVPHNTCQEKLRMTRLGVYYKLHNSFICAGGEIGKDACKGDGGGPLMCLIPENTLQFYQAGIVSWGIGCNSETPAVYASVALFRNWIDQQMTIRNLDKTYYDPEYIE